MSVGDFEYACYCYSLLIVMKFIAGDPLDEMRSLTDTYLHITNKLQQPPVMAYRQMVACLLGETASPTHFHGPYFDESTDFAELTSRGSLFVVKWAYAAIAYTNLLFGKPEEAKRYADFYRPLVSANQGIISSLRDSVFASVINFVCFDQLPTPERRRTLAEARKILKQLKKAMRFCPQNFAHLEELLLAERMRALGKFALAEAHYGKAIELARTEDYCHDEGLAAERAGELALSLGDRTKSKSLFDHSVTAFGRWGAKAKIKQLTTRIAEIFGSTARSAMRSGAEAGEIGSPPVLTTHNLDVGTVIRASQALTENVRLADLLATTMRLIIANAGATHGYLLLESDSEWKIEAAATATDDTVEVLPHRPIGGPKPLLVTKVVQEAMRRSAPLVFDDLSADLAYTDDPCVRAMHPRSLLCLPLRNQNKLNGILYLENNLATGVFSSERVELLKLISTQIAISIENTRLYDGLEAQVAVRTRELDKSLKAVAALLDNSGQGFLAFGGDLVVLGRYSRACEFMLGTVPAGKDVTELLFPNDAAKAELMRTGATMAMAEEDPDRRELILSLLPKEFSHGERLLKAEYKALDSDYVMLVLTDNTEERRLAEKLEVEHKRLQMVVAAVTDNRGFFDTVEAFERFLEDELPALISSSATPDRLVQDLYREVHTYKGVLNQFNFQDAPVGLHRIEEHLAEMIQRCNQVTCKDIADAFARASLRDLFSADLERLAKILGEDFIKAGGRVSLTANQATELEQLANRLLQGGPIDATSVKIRQLLVDICRLSKVPLRNILAQFDSVISRIAGRLGKQVGPLEINGGSDIWIDPRLYRPFLRSLVHVFRNAVAHGIEDPDGRYEAGKDEFGRITCTVSQEGTILRLMIADDGAGVDVRALRQKAVENGLVDPARLATMTEQDTIELIFADNVTTKGEADQYSGRGVGLAAVRAETQRLGGSVAVSSTPGKGTQFAFYFPFGISRQTSI